MKRIQQLDFLRGIAIILVLLRHQELFAFTKNMGWIGVDLFFVLSGFLISGLLFSELKLYNSIDAKSFLIRRAFKIYPLYFLTYPLYLFFIEDIDLKGITADLTFTQNYLFALGYAYGASWSLAVEEHFYFGLALLMLVLTRKHWINQKENKITIFSTDPAKLIMACILMVLLLRTWSYFNFRYTSYLFTMTHLRIDSLLTGVLISYYYHFKKERMIYVLTKYRYCLLFIAVAGLCWTPFIDPVPSNFVRTIGFTLLYISFGIIVSYAVISSNFRDTLIKTLSTPVVSSIEMIGKVSYAIYIIHTFINFSINKMLSGNSVHLSSAWMFLATSIVSIFVGWILTKTVEKYFLKVRDRHYPAPIRQGS